MPESPHSSPSAWRHGALRLTFESLLIVLSILLALAVSQWQKSREERALGRQAIENFRDEIRRNRTAVAEGLPYHRTLRQAMLTSVESGQIKTARDLQHIESWKGLRPAFLTDTAWQSAVATGALPHIDYRIVISLSQTYTLQQRLAAFNQSMTTTLVSPVNFSDDHIQMMVYLTGTMLTDVVLIEEGLLESYDQAISAMADPASLRNGPTAATAPRSSSRPMADP